MPKFDQEKLLKLVSEFRKSVHRLQKMAEKGQKNSYDKQQKNEEVMVKYETRANNWNYGSGWRISI
jgi:hypothetical protein